MGIFSCETESDSALQAYASGRGTLDAVVATCEADLARWLNRKGVQEADAPSITNEVWLDLEKHVKKGKPATLGLLVDIAGKTAADYFEAESEYSSDGHALKSERALQGVFDEYDQLGRAARTGVSSPDTSDCEYRIHTAQRELERNEHNIRMKCLDRGGEPSPPINDSGDERILNNRCLDRWLTRTNDDQRELKHRGALYWAILYNIDYWERNLIELRYLTDPVSELPHALIAKILDISEKTSQRDLEWTEDRLTALAKFQSRNKEDDDLLGAADNRPLCVVKRVHDLVNPQGIPVVLPRARRRRIGGQKIRIEHKHKSTVNPWEGWSPIESPLYLVPPPLPIDDKPTRVRPAIPTIVHCALDLSLLKEHLDEEVVRRENWIRAFIRQTATSDCEEIRQGLGNLGIHVTGRQVKAVVKITTSRERVSKKDRIHELQRQWMATRPVAPHTVIPSPHFSTAAIQKPLQHANSATRNDYRA